MAGQVIHTVSSEKVENLWITGEILTIQIAELALHRAILAWLGSLAKPVEANLSEGRARKTARPPRPRQPLRLTSVAMNTGAAVARPCSKPRQEENPLSSIKA